MALRKGEIYLTKSKLLALIDEGTLKEKWSEIKEIVCRCDNCGHKDMLIKFLKPYETNWTGTSYDGGGTITVPYNLSLIHI